MDKVKVPSGAEVVIREAPFQDVMRLKSAIFSVAAESGLDLEGINFDDDISKLIAPIVKTALHIDSSQKVMEELFNCLQRCTYDGEKITEQTFEATKARGDFYIVAFECIKVNLLPFIAGLRSQLEASGLKIEKILK